jgi:hypothetical protein
MLSFTEVSLRISFAALLIFATFASSAFAEEPEAAVQADAFFKNEVAPILTAKCAKCHGAGEKLESNFKLTDRKSVLAGGDIGPAVDLDSPSESLLLSAINHVDLEMPPTGKLPQAQIDVLTKWVMMGLPFPEGALKIEAHAHAGPPQVNDENRKFWSFQPVKRPKVPEVGSSGWATNEIDRFILAKLEANGLAPNPPAGKATLIRRATYDLTGLPPTPEEVQRFLDDESPEAYARLIDRLLDSPHYGEKWGRHWLDLVHYAESNSFERDNPKPDVWRYRDYVIRSFNADKPYDQFVREQLAGDQIEPITADGIIATGYYRLGLWDDESADPPQTRYDELDDWVTVTSQAMLGLTMNCARCHDHKLDPIPQKDYYRMVAFFRDIRSFQNGNDGMGKGFSGGSFHRKLADLVPRDALTQSGTGLKFDEAKLSELNSQVERLQKEITEKLPGGVRDDFQYESNQLVIARERTGREIPPDLAEQFVAAFKARQDLLHVKSSLEASVLCATTNSSVADTAVLARGNPGSPGEVVAPGFPSILGFADPQLPTNEQGKTTARRRALADWMVSPQNPLTSRVIVNRIWQHHFGRGIVRSPNDFGFKGEPPTHPELLDYLATEFVENGWRMKALHRLLMLSSAYRMSSQITPAAYEKDPRNDLFWRLDPRRLTAEEIRDSILFVNGTLNREMFGPSIYTLIPQEVLAGQSMPGHNWRTSDAKQQSRRSVYIHVKRSLIEPFLEQFDAPDVDNSCPVRFTTTLPTQALGMFNSEFTSGEAQKLATRLSADAGDEPRDQIARAIWLTTQREPTAADLERGLALLGKLKANHQLADAQALKYYCLILLNASEFVYVD